jgi:hypothetical protein
MLLAYVSPCASFFPLYPFAPRLAKLSAAHAQKNGRAAGAPPFKIASAVIAGRYFFFL